MKKFLALLIPILALASCTSPKGYTIKASLSGIPDSTMFYLYSSEAGETIDSVRLLDGKLELRGTMAAPPEMFHLSARIGKESIYVPLLIGNEKLTIRGDRADFPFDLSFSGSKFQAQNQTCIDLTKAYDKERDSLVKIFFFASPEAQKEMDEAMWGKEGRIRKIDETTDSLRKLFVKSHIDTYIGLIQLGYLKGQMPRDTVEKLYNSLTPQMQQSRYGKSIEIFLNVKRVKTGEPYYDIEGLDASGKEMKLSDLQTEYILLDFTSIGCGPCRKSTPELREIDSLYPGKLTLVSISMDKSKNHWQDMIREDNITWPYLWNGEGFDGATAMAYGIRGIPNFVLIGPERTLIDQWGGYDMQNYGKLIERIDKNLGITR